MTGVAPIILLCILAAGAAYAIADRILTWAEKRPYDGEG